MFPMQMLTNSEEDEVRDRANQVIKRVNLVNANEKFPDEFKSKFYAPDLRTDYFPSYTLLQPNLEGKPEFDAEKLAEMWDEKELEQEFKALLQERFEEASALFDALRDNAPTENDLAKVYHNLGNSLVKEQKLEEAIENFICSIKLNPNYNKAWENIYYPIQAIKYKNTMDKNYPSFILNEKLLGKNNIELAILKFRLNISSLNWFSPQTLDIDNELTIFSSPIINKYFSESIHVLL